MQEFWKGRGAVPVLEGSVNVCVLVTVESVGFRERHSILTSLSQRRLDRPGSRLDRPGSRVEFGIPSG